MPQQQTQKGSEYNQESFIGGMNLLEDDTHLATNEYRVGFNIRNRYGRLDPVLSSQQDKAAPHGLVQEMITFGNFEILFVSGRAFYKYYTATGWTQIHDFSMSESAPRYWTVAIPTAQTNYIRIAASSASINGIPDSRQPVTVNLIAGAAAGNLPGLLVQDNINQPQFIYLDQVGTPQCRTTKTFDEWFIQFSDANNTRVVDDQREYVPIGNAMAFVDDILYIASPDKEAILRSVSGRPLDFVVAVSNLLATTAPFKQFGGADAYATAYTVGVGGISCLRALSDGSLFVAASNANFSVSKNMTQEAPKEFGEYTFIRKFLFNANCLSDRVIFDTVGDTRFIDLTGVRSFNAIKQGNEGRNSVFTATIQSAFTKRVNGALTTLLQDENNTAGILYNDFELYAVNTVFGPAIAVYDTVIQKWASFDISQTGGKRIKILSKIELAVQALYAVTEDNKVYRLYVGPNEDQGEFRTVSVCSNILYAGQNVKMANPKNEIQLRKTRVIINNIFKDCVCSMTPFVNNRLNAVETQGKSIKYRPPNVSHSDANNLDDVNSQLENLLFSTPNIGQGWKVYSVFKWNTGSLTQFSMELTDITPMNPLLTQGNAQ